MSQAGWPVLILFLTENFKKGKQIVEIYMSACMIHEGGGAELDLRYEKETRDSVVMCYHEKISPY